MVTLISASSPTATLSRPPRPPGGPAARDGGPLTQPADVVTGRAVDGDADLGIQPDREAVTAARVADCHRCSRGELTQSGIDSPHAQSLRIQLEAGGRRARGGFRRAAITQSGHTDHRYTSSGMGSNTRASAIPGSPDSARHSLAIATQPGPSAISAGLHAMASRTTANSVGVVASSV